MKSVLFVLAFTMLVFGIAFAQTPPSTIELSTSPTVDFIDDDRGDDELLVVIPVRLGVFLVKGFELEPEISVFFPDESELTGAVFLLNAAYNFLEGSRVRPFVLAGIGFGNAVRIANLAADVDESVFVLDAGLGLKAFLNKHVAFRAEYRFERSSYERDVPYWYVHGRDVDVNVHRMMFGFSIIFNNG
ncbi:MAG: outer membrane beta-barrel protein [Candidatus Latescibacterota bacterium]|nr:MAG: outer membrane beta-barrel protein [Candidatus Latescibacterota bacterium]